MTTVPVTIEGKWQTMYAVALHESFAAGSCYQTIFAHSPHDTGCTLPALGVAFVLWQSRSGNAPPDRLLVFLSEVGTSNFGFYPDIASHPDYALYARGADEDWMYKEGTLTSALTETTTPCGVPMPTFAKSGTCSNATFDEEGSVTFLNIAGTCCATETITIPRASLRGLSMAISETQPVQ